MASPLEGQIASLIYTGMRGLFLDATLTRDGVNSGEPYDPDVAAPAVYPCKAIALQYARGVKGSDLVGATDVNVMILTNSLAVAPEPLDRIAIPSKGVSGVIYDGNTGMQAVKADPANATWECRVVT